MIRPAGADISRFCDLDRYKATGVQIRTFIIFCVLMISEVTQSIYNLIQYTLLGIQLRQKVATFANYVSNKL